MELNNEGFFSAMPGYYGLEEKLMGSNDTIKEQVNKKIVIDLFASPMTFVPVVAGLSVFILGWLLSSMMAAGVGLLSTLVGCGIFATRLIYGMDDIAKAAYDELLKQEEVQKEQKLNDLLFRLKQDRDSRPEKCLQELRSIRKVLSDELKDRAFGGEIIDNFNALFDQCVKHIEETDQLWRGSRVFSGSTKKKMKADREKLIVEIEATTAKLVDYANEIRCDRNSEEMKSSMLELEQSLEVARRTEERLSNLTNKSYDPKEFE